MRLNRITLLLYGLGLGVLSWLVAAPFWAYVIMGLVFASAAFGLYEKLAGWIKSERWAATATILIILIAIILPISFLTWQIVQDMRDLVASLSVEQVSTQVETLAIWSHETFGYPQNLEQTKSEEILKEIIPEIRSRLTTWIPQAIASAGAFLIGVFVMILTIYYALLEGPQFVDQLKRASPMDDQLEGEFLGEAKNTVDGVLMGQLVTAALQGGLGYLAFVIAGIPNAFFWSFVMAILSFLPLVGAFLVWMPAAVYLFATGNTPMGIFMVAWGIFVVSSVDNIVKPMIIGKRGKLHPLLAFIGVLGGLAAFGFMGFVLGPLVLSLFASVFGVLADMGWEPEEGLDDQPAEPGDPEAPADGAPGEPSPEGA